MFMLLRTILITLILKFKLIFLFTLYLMNVIIYVNMMGQIFKYYWLLIK